jgi:hypothetical protein
VWSAWWSIPVSVLGALAVVWLILAVTLWLVRPDEVGIQDVVRLLPDLLRLFKRLAADPETPRAIRIVLVALLAVVVLAVRLLRRERLDGRAAFEVCRAGCNRRRFRWVRRWPHQGLPRFITCP